MDVAVAEESRVTLCYTRPSTLPRLNQLQHRYCAERSSSGNQTPLVLSGWDETLDPDEGDATQDAGRG